MSGGQKAGAGEMAIWQVPVLVLAGLAAIAGLAVTIAVWQGALPAPWGPALQWGLAGASLTFTLARVVHVRSLGRRELELLVMGVGILLTHLFTVGLGAVVIIALIALVLDEL